jgi:hypothetical protein
MPLLNLDFFGYFDIMFSSDFILNRNLPKILYFGYFLIRKDSNFHCSCLFCNFLLFHFLCLLILGVFGVKCLDFGTYSVFEIFNYLMPKSSVGYDTHILDYHNRDVLHMKVYGTSTPYHS